jgi:hypothetical protein
MSTSLFDLIKFLKLLIGNQNIFLEKKHTPLPPFKLNGRSLSDKIQEHGIGFQ